jgi:hypothetical protein
MKLVSKISLALGLAALLGASVTNAAPITYFVNRTIGAGSVTGDIVTDGNSGLLGIADINGWTLHLNNGASTFDLTSGNSYLFGSGQVNASPTQLTYDFNSGNYFGFFVNGTVGSNFLTGWCLQSSSGQCTFGGAAGEVVGVNNSAFNGPFVGLTGTHVIASVPEPETYAMMMAGLGMMGFMVRRRKRG